LRTVKNRFLRCSLLALVVAALALPQCRADDGLLIRIWDFYRYRPYPVDHFAPGYYGYNLDDYSRGYYGGGRYTEYYNYGRGGGISSLANFPGPAPGPQWLYDNRNWVGTQPVQPFAPPPVRKVGGSGPARLTIQVPPDAVLWLEGQPTQQTGAVRQFVTPPLEAGVPYTYTIRARWQEGGQPVEQVQSLSVQAGQQRSASFPSAGPIPVAAPPRLLPAGLGE
jgi:uncharacterized protein (TIGR03000 family)